MQSDIQNILRVGLFLNSTIEFSRKSCWLRLYPYFPFPLLHRYNAVASAALTLHKSINYNLYAKPSHCVIYKNFPRFLFFYKHQIHCHFLNPDIPGLMRPTWLLPTPGDLRSLEKSIIGRSFALGMTYMHLRDSMDSIRAVAVTRLNGLDSWFIGWNQCFQLVYIYLSN